jgi:hypothetical protein
MPVQFCSFRASVGAELFAWNNFEFAKQLRSARIWSDFIQATQTNPIDLNR